jgi:outer membrane protein OmpA-like peptidoglycan-associated protein
MKTTLHRRIEITIIFAMTLAFAAMLPAQDTGKPTAIPVGQTMTIEGVILNHQADNLTVRTPGNNVYTVMVADNTQLKEKKSNPFRSAKKYSREGLVAGLQIEVKGAGTNSGALSAREIRFRNEDFITAQTMDTRVIPVEKSLRDTQTRLGETEQNARSLSDQVQELSDMSNTARRGVKTAQGTANHALTAASAAQSSADKAKAGVRAANERIAHLDDFDVKESTTIYFNQGSAKLSPKNQSGLAKFAEQTSAEKGYVIEVAGFTSSDGAMDMNRRLSQKRADAVIQYLAENFQIPVRRFVVPMGYGESHPAADNKTLAGRKENRRVEVRLLISKGLETPSESEETPRIETSQLR